MESLGIVSRWSQPNRFPSSLLAAIAFKKWRCTGATEVMASASSFPSMASRTMALSMTVLVMGPGVSSVLEMGTMPVRLASPMVGFNPTTEFMLEGERMEPEVSVPMAAEVTASLGGSGIWGVEFFIQSPREGLPGTVYFSELSPRPHDTGMVTLAGTQNFSEFELHARAVLGLPVAEIKHIRNGASAVVLAPETCVPGAEPVVSGLAEAASFPNTDFRVFGKPTVRPYRRMAVGLADGDQDSEVNELVNRENRSQLLSKLNRSLI